MNESAGGSGRRASGRRRIALIGAAIAAGGGLWLTRAFEQTGDSLSYAWAIRARADLFHPHHLLFNPIIVLVRGILKIFWPDVSVIEAAQVHNILWALAGLFALGLIIRRVSGTWAGGGWAAAGLLASYGFWHYTTLVEVYIPAMGALTVTLALLLMRPAATLRTGRQALIGFGFALAVFYHQMFLLWALPLAVLLFGLWGRSGWKPVLRILIFAGGLIAAGYAVAYATTGGEASIEGFFRWFFEYSYHPNPGWGTLKNFSFLGLAKLLLSQAIDFVYLEKALYLPAAALYGAFLLVLIGWNTIRVVRRASDSALRLLAIVWIVVFNAFLLWWSPFGFELSIHLLIPVFILTALGLRDLTERVLPRPAATRNAGAILAGIIILIGGANAWTAIGPKHSGLGVAYSQAERLDLLSPRDAIFLTDWDVGQNLRYYFERDRVLWIDVVGYSFYRHLRLPPTYDLERTRPIIVSGEGFDPDSRAFKMYTADSKPSEWLSLLGWAFDVQDGDGPGLNCRRVSRLSQEGNVLVLEAERISFLDLADFCSILDQVIGDRLLAPPDPFRRWLSRHPELPPLPGWPSLSLSVPSSRLTHSGEIGE